MYRGMISFNCSECGTKFSSLFNGLNKWRYEKIWEKMEDK